MLIDESAGKFCRQGQNYARVQVYAVRLRDSGRRKHESRDKRAGAGSKAHLHGGHAGKYAQAGSGRKEGSGTACSEAQESCRVWCKQC